MVRAVVLLVLLALVCLDSCLFVFSMRNAHHITTVSQRNGQREDPKDRTQKMREANEAQTKQEIK